MKGIYMGVEIVNYLKSDVYLMVYQNHEDEEGESQAIKCKIIHSGIVEDKEGRLSFLCNLAPIEDLPEWYDEDRIESDFSDVSIDRLYTDPYWCS